MIADIAKVEDPLFPSNPRKRDFTAIDDTPVDTESSTRSKKRPRQAHSDDKSPDLLKSVPAIADDVLKLQESHNLFSINVHNGTEIRAKVTKIRKVLSSFSWKELGAKPNLLILHAQAEHASKLVSIVEIAKREVIKEKLEFYQYSKVEGVLTRVIPKEPKTASANAREVVALQIMDRKVCKGEEDNDYTESTKIDKDEDEFEVMPTPGQRRERPIKERNKPVMTIFLTMVPIPKLDSSLGRQTK
ncbi:MAG: hypothetical protein M1814_001680 [Vezdaea aestivalis]|nr:MAG: hypothetical protein M1814_001680 [Vezdaea aestivalis]